VIFLTVFTVLILLVSIDFVGTFADVVRSCIIPFAQLIPVVFFKILFAADKRTIELLHSPLGILTPIALLAAVDTQLSESTTT
jgi:hypothetical protein